ncbi:hypothetical protein HALLA_06950 [Halostagnicola larsenii XH-48]|uniref:Uncharacterized protein n=1 Tax=Halostagnicola larsenii XH-48 TaxID=797299 RepID=W0JUR2_9EURY|nr:hypothetical protein HALLA_06950 [Halostagnicola larsenii XH-48]
MIGDGRRFREPQRARHGRGDRIEQTSRRRGAISRGRAV